jgi:hypothetical protein
MRFFIHPNFPVLSDTVGSLFMKRFQHRSDFRLPASQRGLHLLHPCRPESPSKAAATVLSESTILLHVLRLRAYTLQRLYGGTPPESISALGKAWVPLLSDGTILMSTLHLNERQRSIAMNSKKSMVFFGLLFPITFLVGLLANVAYSLQFHENVQVNWLLVLSIAVVLDLLFTWRYDRDSKSDKDTAHT